MLTTAQHDRIARKCAAALSAVIEALPQLLADSDPDTAAAIAADLVKSYLVGPAPEVDSGAALAEIIRRTQEMSEAESQQPPSEPWTDTYPTAYAPEPVSAQSSTGSAEATCPSDSETENLESQTEDEWPCILASPSHTWDV